MFRHRVIYRVICIITGPILAFAQTIHMTASFLSPAVAGLLIERSVSKYFLSFSLQFPWKLNKFPFYEMTNHT